MEFSYVDIVTKGCEGWLNLFFGDYAVACIYDVWLADKMREVLPKKTNTILTYPARR